MANTISDRTWRDKYRSATLDKLLRDALVTEAICEVDRSDNYRIQSPYGSQPSAEVQALSGHYVSDDFTTTDDVLTVTDEVIVSEHIFDFESVMSNFDLFASRTEEMVYSVANRIDRYVLNVLLDGANESYSTPSGGFTDPVNINEILPSLIGKVAGRSDVYKGLFLVIENTDLAGFVESQSKSGFSFADAALYNGFYSSPMGVDVYVVRSGTFADETLGTQSYTNDGHRVFGVKNVATYASPRGIRWDEKGVSGKTGKEVVCWGYIGFKLWTPKIDLVVDITLA
jgi:hypothetical protein